MGGGAVIVVVDGFEAEVIDGEVGAGVVADGDHEGERVFRGEGEGRVEEEEDAGAGDLVLMAEGELVVEVDAARRGSAGGRCRGR